MKRVTNKETVSKTQDVNGEKSGKRDKEVRVRQGGVAGRAAASKYH